MLISSNSYTSEVIKDDWPLTENLWAFFANTQVARFGKRVKFRVCIKIVFWVCFPIVFWVCFPVVLWIYFPVVFRVHLPGLKTIAPIAYI